MATLEAFSERRATAWDPACPSKLVVVGDAAATAEGNGATAAATKTLDNLLSDRSGCNAHELAALIKIIQAHKDYNYDEYYQSQTTGARFLSDSCRLAVQDCLDGWEREKRGESTTAAAAANDNDDDEDEDEDEDTKDSNNLELLKLELAVLHLSDIFLPLLLPNPMSPGYSSSKAGGRGEQQISSTTWTDSFYKPGAVTASLVRFLRYHYDSPALVHPDVSDMLKSEQPELYGEDMLYEGTTLLYWRYVETCVLRGCLTQAWEALERHSLYQNATAVLSVAQYDDDHENDTSDPLLIQNAQDIVAGFDTLRQVLCLAPLPGGRTDINDDLVANTDQDIAEEEELEEDAYLPGLDVAPGDFKYWEVENDPSSHQDLPKVYTSDAALRKHNNWQRYLEERVIPRFRLLYRIPELKRVLNILVGDLDEVAISSWAEHLCASLLYQTPAIKPSQIPSLAARFMTIVRDSDDTLGDDLDSLPSEKRIFLDIMQGRAGEAMDALYVLGGATGAALPTTLMAVMYTLYLDANILAPEAGFRQMEFLCQAALAIVSSLADNAESPDTATSLALQLLIPHMATPVGGNTRKNNQIAMCMVHILEHYFPRSDAGARAIVSLISSAILGDEAGDGNTSAAASSAKRLLHHPPRKSNHFLPLFEAIETVFLCRYRHYMQQGSPGLAVQWLIEGIQFISHSDSFNGSCYRTLCALCNSCSSDLLSMLAGTKDYAVFGKMHRDAESIVSSIRENSFVQVSKDGACMLTSVREVQVLLTTEGLVDAYVIRKDYESAAKQVIACIEETKDRASGSVGKLLPFSLQWHLLVIAKDILMNDESRFNSNPTCETFSSFNQKGITSLLEALQQVTKLFTGCKSIWGPSSDKELYEMKGLLGRVLARACVAENAKRKKQQHGRSMDRTIASIRSMDLALHPPNMQQAVVLNMLDL